MPIRPPRRPLAVRPAVGIADRPTDDYVSRVAVRQPDRMPDGGGRPYGRSPQPSAWPSVPAIRYGRPPGRPPAVRTADGLQPHPLTRQPPSSAANGTLNGRISGEYKEGSTNTLNLLPNLCFPRALSCTLHLLLGKPLLRKSEIVLGVSFGTPNTISAAWLLHSFIPYFCTHCNGQQTMVPLVHRNLSRSWQKK